MQITVEDVSAVEKILHIEVPAKAVTKELDNAYKTLKKTAKIKGFRPGKAPRAVLERYFKKDVHNDVISKLLQESMLAAITENNLNIVGNPKIDPPELDAKEPYKYEAAVEVRPEIGEIDITGLTLEKKSYTVSDEEIDTQLKLLQKNLTQQEPVTEDRPVQENDFVLIDYEGFKDGQPFAETQKTENFTMKIGDGHISKSFDEQLIGMKAGDSKEIDVKFPENYFNDKLADHKITFAVTLHQIREQKIPEIDDEFAKQFGDYENLDALKAVIIDNLDQGYAKRVEQELNEQVFEALIKKTDFELPPSMVEYELQGIIEEAERSFAYHNKSMEDLGLSTEQLSEKYQETAQKQVRRHLILNQIIDQEKLTVSDESLENGYQEMAQSLHQPAEQIRAYYQQNEDKLEFFKHALLEKDAIKLIIEKSTVTDMATEPATQPQDKKEDRK